MQETWQAAGWDSIKATSVLGGAGVWRASGAVPTDAGRHSFLEVSYICKHFGT